MSATDKSDNIPSADTVQMVISDVDGTLLDAHHRFHFRTYRAMSYIRQTRPDFPIVLATGKQRSAVDLIRIPLGKVVSAEYLEPSVVMEVVEATKHNPNIANVVYDDQNVYILTPGREDLKNVKRLEEIGEKVVWSMPFEEAKAKVLSGEIKVIKMAVCEDPDKLDVVRDILKPFPKDKFTTTQALAYCIELIPSSCNKGTALQTITSKILPHIKNENVIAFGDGQNDLTMFGVAGWSVAVKNGMQIAIDNARAVSRVGNDEGAVGEVLERVFNIPEDYTPPEYKF
ncbi:nucleotide-sugar phosphatase [Schizosaccharomyces cryophilus OY26]|uniref:Nucleotide-sugar phosphatase n=1 Tax=Schizosaccharomyces cryophilus (strain OY26 / ATCC MYA-4695 / CBS 11777 / NBRC 106824 / NRRL Y48691) TaxID=653667 RepID=S9VYX3_SCHCR|nr:nucleotide-sugar phosphatase [Schizosaccharomyces cryophilus OY26]EPY51414.1 nucleotide-sugar phosphatase [Schizosaccharomyces cryophilus OY26]